VPDFDRDLSTRLGALTGDASPLDAAILPAIRRRAAAERRRRRGVAVSLAALTLAAGAGVAVVAQAAPSRPSPGALAPARADLLGWPSRGSLVDGTDLDRIVTAWNAQGGTGHTQVRLLFAGRSAANSTTGSGHVIVIVEGRSAAGQARLAVLVGRPVNPGQNTPGYRLSVDVATPPVTRQVLLVTVNGLETSPAQGRPGSDSAVVIALMGPTSQPATLRMIALAGQTPIRLDPSVGYLMVDLTASSVPADRRTIASGEQVDSYLLGDANGARLQAFHTIAPDDDRFDGWDGPRAAVLVPAR